MNEKKKKRVIPKKQSMHDVPLNEMQIVKESKNNVICIIGMHRSGTSMVAKLLNLCGLYLGPSEKLMKPNEHNLLGHFENEDFAYKINDVLLSRHGGSWDNPSLLNQDWEYDPSLKEIVHKAMSTIETFSKSSLWGWKDPRTTLLLPFWKSLIPNLRFVICVRSPLEVAKSLARRDKFTIRKGVYLWNQYMQAAIRDTEGCPRIFTFYEDFFKDAPGEIDRLVGFCGLQKPDDISTLYSSISSELKHHTSETLELLNESKVITEYKLFYIGLRALTNDKFLSSTLNGSREELVSENIGKLFKLIEEFHDEQKMAQLQSALEDKDQQIAKLHDTVHQKKKELSLKEEQVNQFQGTVQSQQEALTEKEKQICELTEDRDRLSHESDKLHDMMQSQQEALTEKEKQICELTEERDRLSHESGKLHDMMQSQQEALTEKEKNVADIQAVIESKVQTIRQQSELVDRITVEKNQLNQTLHFVGNSLGWKLITKLYDLEEKFMPQGTYRRNNYNLFWKGMQTLFSQGWSRFELEIKNNLKARKKQPLECNPVILPDNFGTVKKPDNNASPKKESILVIDRFVPTYDQDSGSLRMYTILSILNEIGYEVVFLPDDFDIGEPYTIELQHKGINIIDRNTNVEEYLRKTGHLFSFVIISRPEQAFKYIPLIRAYNTFCTIIYDTVDLHWIRLERTASVNGKDELLNEAKYYKSVELLNAKRSDIIFTVTHDEKKFLLEEIPELKIEVIPNIHEVIKPDRAFRKRKDIMFIGSFWHDPNEDAVFYFINEIFPAIKEEIADIRFFIVGSKPSDALLKLNSEDIIVTGYVKNVLPYFRNCRVFVSPLRCGAGMKGKIGQSMAYGLPVVTTKIGAEGIGLVNGENALIADEPEAFADAVIKLYEDEPLWNKISKQSIEHIEKNYSKELTSEKLAEIFHSVKQKKLQDETAFSIETKPTAVG